MSKNIKILSKIPFEGGVQVQYAEGDTVKGIALPDGTEKDSLMMSKIRELSKEIELSGTLESIEKERLEKVAKTRAELEEKRRVEKVENDVRYEKSKARFVELMKAGDFHAAYEELKPRV